MGLVQEPHQIFALLGNLIKMRVAVKFDLAQWSQSLAIV